jgi:hypothetical protein
VLIGRRHLLLSLAAVSVAGCARVPPRFEAPTPALPADIERWNQQAQATLSDVLKSLRTFDDFQAFRVSTARESDTRLASELVWDAPTGAAWDEATHVTRGLHGRADLLFTAVSATRIDPSLWREQRLLADATHDLLDLSDALSAYRDRVDGMPPGDGSGALALLDRAWAQWDAAAARFGVSRAESLGCEAREPSGSA